MAITRHAGQILRGLQADTKPTTNVLPNTLFIETDTRMTYLWNGTSWNAAGSVVTTLDSLTDVVAPTPAANDILKFDSGSSTWKPGTGVTGITKVYKIGSTYYAEDNSGTVLASSGTLDTVLQTALNQTGEIHMTQATTFVLSNTTPITIPAFTSLRMSPNTILQVPSGFNNATTGILNFQADSTSTDHISSSHIFGGRIQKAAVNATENITATDKTFDVFGLYVESK